MYSAQKELEQLKQVYQQQEIPHGIKNEMIKRYSLEEQRFNQRVKRKKTSERTYSIFCYYCDDVQQYFF